jgi:hypothetical protein
LGVRQTEVEVEISMQLGRKIPLVSGAVVVAVLGAAYGAYALGNGGDADLRMQQAPYDFQGNSSTEPGHSVEGVTDTATHVLREVLAEGSDDPLMLPATLPEGGIPAESSFLLTGVPVTDRTPEGRVWRMEYSPEALPPARESVGGYTIYQLPLGADLDGRCGEQPHVVREVDRHQLVICLGPNPTGIATDYWSDVRFSPDLDSVKWLDLKGADK